METEQPQECYWIGCVGKDENLHICLPWETRAPCGVEITNKKLKDYDYLNRYTCIECDYMDAP